MDEALSRKYGRVLEIMPDVAECAEGKLILVGGTALALFHLQHRISIDLDFVPADGDDARLKEFLKGRLSKKGYRTSAGAFQNQFVIQFEDTSIKVEVFEPENRVGKYAEHEFGLSKLKVASLGDLLEMKKQSYADRLEARDLFDIIFILRKEGKGTEAAEELVRKIGKPKNVEAVRGMALREEDYELMVSVIRNASKASG